MHFFIWSIGLGIPKWTLTWFCWEFLFFLTLLLRAMLSKLSYFPIEKLLFHLQANNMAQEVPSQSAILPETSRGNR